MSPDLLTATIVMSFCRMTIGLVFLIAVLGKIGNLQSFINTVIDFNIFPYKSSKILANVIIGLEILIVLFMFTNNDMLLWGWTISLILLTSFSLAMLIAIIRRKDISCRCFGLSGEKVSFIDIFRNFLLILCSLIGLSIYTFTTKTWLPLNEIQGLLLILTTITCTLILVFIKDIVYLIKNAYHFE